MKTFSFTYEEDQYLSGDESELYRACLQNMETPLGLDPEKAKEGDCLILLLPIFSLDEMIRYSHYRAHIQEVYRERETGRLGAKGFMHNAYFSELHDFIRANVRVMTPDLYHLFDFVHEKGLLPKALSSKVAFPKKPLL